MITLTEVVEIADHIKFNGGKPAYKATELISELAGPEDFEPGDLRRVARILDRDWGIQACPVNALYFTEGMDISSPQDARTCLPKKGRPSAGLHIIQGTDDHFAVLLSSRSVLRAAVALPRAARRLAGQVERGALSEAASGELVVAAQHRAAEEVTPEIEGSVRQMLPLAG